jgi:hypothetical protein
VNFAIINSAGKQRQKPQQQQQQQQQQSAEDFGRWTASSWV